MAHTVGVTLVGTVGVTLGHTLWYVSVTIRLYCTTLGYTVGNTLVCGCGCGCVHVGVGVGVGTLVLLYRIQLLCLSQRCLNISDILSSRLKVSTQSARRAVTRTPRYGLPALL